MKKIITIITLLFITNTIFTPKAEAHFLATDKNIGAILHVDPNDQPVAGETDSFFFEFKDRQNKFTPANCDCTFEIDENGTNIYSQSLFKNNTKPALDNASISYTFPKRDVYQVKVIGKPLATNGFQPFSLIWNFRVDQEVEGTATQSNPSFITSHLLLILAGGVIVVLFLIYLLRPRKPHKSNQIKHGEERKDNEKERSEVY